MQIGNPEHVKMFANQRCCGTWFEENAEGVAFEYDVLG